MVETEAECPHCAGVLRARAADAEQAWVTCPHCHVRSPRTDWQAHAPDVQAVNPSPEPDDQGPVPSGRDGQWWMVLVVLLIAVGLAGGPRALYFSVKQWLSGQTLLDDPSPAFAAVRGRLGNAKLSLVSVTPDNVLFEVQDQGAPQKFERYLYQSGSLNEPDVAKSGSRHVVTLDAIDLTALRRAVEDARARVGPSSGEVSKVIVTSHHGEPKLSLRADSERERWDFAYDKQGVPLEKR